MSRDQILKKTESNVKKTGDQDKPFNPLCFITKKFVYPTNPESDEFLHCFHVFIIGLFRFDDKILCTCYARSPVN